jgi:hypothetical protein
MVVSSMAQGGGPCFDTGQNIILDVQTAWLSCSRPKPWIMSKSLKPTKKLSVYLRIIHQDKQVKISLGVVIAQGDGNRL